MSLTHVGEAVLAKLADFALERLKTKLTTPAGTGPVTIIAPATARDALLQHFGYVSRWAADISFRDLWKSKSLQESFVDLDLGIGPVRSRSEAWRSSAFRVSELALMKDHHVLLGDPGAGKTTSLKRIALTTLRHFENGTRTRPPLLVRLRSLTAGDTVTDTLLAALGVSVQVHESVDTKQRSNFRRHALCHFIDDMDALLLLDGLDELPLSLKVDVVEEIRDLLLRLTRARIIVTCRTGDFRYHLERATPLSIAPLSQSQIEQFASRWLGARDAPSFLRKIWSTPYSGSEVRPLTLAHLCAIYERTNDIPAKPRTVYRKIVRLFLEEWDEQQSVRRISQYAAFTTDRKEEFLEALAYCITQLHITSFSHAVLGDAYKRIHARFALPAADASKVMGEIESHTGLVMEVASDSFEFAHTSLQEYLTANYLIKLPELDADVLVTMPNEAAIAVALSSDSTSYVVLLLSHILRIDSLAVAAFAGQFLRRMQTERVDLVPSAELGVAALALFTATYHPRPTAQRVSPLVVARQVFVDFIQSEPIAQSIVLALRRSDVQPDGDLIHISPTRSISWRIIPDGFRLTLDATLMPPSSSALG